MFLPDHQPRDAAKAAAIGVALQLSGQTRGGMVMGFNRLVARANSGFVSGAYAVGGMTHFVNNGTALSPGFALPRPDRGAHLDIGPSDIAHRTERRRRAQLARDVMREVLGGVRDSSRATHENEVDVRQPRHTVLLAEPAHAA